MEKSQEITFPREFGTSADDFLQRYESLIYKIIYERTRNDPGFEAEDLFHEFFLNLAENNFRRLRSFRGESQPTTYLGRVLRNFLCDRYRERRRIDTSSDSLEELTEQGREIVPAASVAPDPPAPESILDSELIGEALKATFSKLSNREKLIYDLFIDREMTAQEISSLLGVKVKSVYKNHEKVKKILKGELEKRGIVDF
jgi:RNA polymerase sigma factor (sigma-70 family)